MTLLDPTLATPRQLTLPDGRALAWYEFGDPDGVPCVYTTGTPASGLVGLGYDAGARAAGIRWISVDKPGYGHSDYDPQRSLLRYAQDVEALLDHLGLERTAVAGESGGGPHVLALAYALPARVTTALVLAGMGPGDGDWVREGMKPMNRRLFWLARRAPWLLRPALGSMGRKLADERKRAAFVEKQSSVAPPADLAVMEANPGLLELTIAGAAGAFRQGPRGAAQEMAVFGRPWGFALEDVNVPVELWHGTQDVNVPVAVAREVARRLPNCRARIYEGEGHALAFSHQEEIFGVVRDAA